MSISVGSIIWIAVKPIIKVFLIVGTGFLLSKRNVLTSETSRNISDIVVTILVPCLTFYKIVTNVSDSDIKSIGIIVLTSFILFSLGGIGSFIIKLVTPVPQFWYGGLLIAGILPNVQDITVAMLQTMDTGVVFTAEEADKGVTYVIIFFTTFTIVLFNLGGFRLIEWDFIRERKAKDKQDIESVHVEEKKKKHAKSNSSGDNNDINIGVTDLGIDSGSADLPIPLLDDPYSMHSIGSYESHTESLRRLCEIRTFQSQNMEDVIIDYKNDLPATTLQKILTTDVGVTNEEIKKCSNPNSLIQKYHLNFFVFFLKNCVRPCSIATILALTIAFVPWLKALFVHTTVTMPDAPDQLPPLNFIMDYTSYVSNAAIPFALLLLGGTIAKIEVTVLPKGFWKSALILTALRLVILPIIGVLWSRALIAMKWVDKDTDQVLIFVLIITFGLPTMTSIIYFTAFHTSLDSEERVQMNCVSIIFLMQYPILAISLPILVSYVLKVELEY